MPSLTDETPGSQSPALSPPRARRQFFPQLDGLRAAAVFLVLMFHVNIDGMRMPAGLAIPFSCGWIGVDAFFVLSGFLITKILLDYKPGPRAYGVFVLRRTLRTWPLYFATLLAAYLTLHISGTGERVNWIQHLFFLQNYAPDWVASSLGATWSLCIEEHFYIVWPLLIFLLPRRLLAWTMSGVFLSLPLLRFWGLHHDFTHKQLYSETQFHLDGLAAGSLVALLVFYYAVRPRTLKWIAYACLFVGTSCSLLGFWKGWDVVRGDNIIFGFTFLAIAFAGLLMILLDGGGPVLGRLFGFGPVRYVGRISYGIYLLHMGIFALLGRLALQRFFGEWSESWAFSIPLRIGVTIGVAALSYRFFESPILRFKDGVR